MKNNQLTDEIGGEFVNPCRGILITGSVGSGKSVSVDQWITKLRKRRDRSNGTTES